MRASILFHRFRLRGGVQHGAFLGCRDDLASTDEAADFAQRAYAWAVSHYAADDIEVERIACTYPADWPDFTAQLLAAGQSNPWIREACDPPFDARCLAVCPDLPTLADQVFVGNWCLGQGFVWHDVAVMNQVDGGHEWLVCIRGVAVESFSHANRDAFLAGLESLRSEG